MHWLKKLKSRVCFNEDLSAYTTLQIGGPCDALVEPKDLNDLKEVVLGAVQKNIPCLVIGKGSNLLVRDQGFRGIVIRLTNPFFTQIEFKEKRLFCGAGVTLNKLIHQTKHLGLGGLEFLAGIPASLGGALVMNAGSRTNSIGNLVSNVTVMDRQGKIRLLKKRQLKFSYRHSNLNRYIVLQATLKLIKSSPTEIKKNITSVLAQKRKTQDLTARSAGCIFKNPRHGLSAGKLIEACGLKKRRYGGAEISCKHANFMVNRNGAKAKDFLYLINLVQKKVKKKFGVLLEPEVKIIP